MAAYDEQTRVSSFVYVVMLVIIGAFGVLVWNWFSGGGGGEAPRIDPPAGAYKIAPPPDASNAPDAAEDNAFLDTLAGEQESGQVNVRAGPEAPLDAPAAAAEEGRPRLSPTPRFVSNGAYVAQVAALQSEAAVDAAWRRLSSRAPDLFASARLDVERADLGQRGVYYRVRAGYFADRENAHLFCDRIKNMGQDCIVVAR